MKFSVVSDHFPLSFTSASGLNAVLLLAATLRQQKVYNVVREELKTYKQKQVRTHDNQLNDMGFIPLANKEDYK
ncbi:hypothetical protein [Herbaspirillum aquaticum]|uniref:hypothetical protein n=1 Tax=Herbaspirillum aquaticum TaxID=568783 RepID=UPI0011309825|nr:hypothetical protein [Herbaspirillum aquaticum]